MNIKNLEGYISNADDMSYGIDFLRLNLKTIIPSLSEPLHKLDDDNSNTFMKDVGDYSLTMVKTRTRNGSALNISVSIDDVSYTLWQYSEYSEGNKKVIKWEGALVYYSTYFRLIEIWLLDYSFEKEIFGKELVDIQEASITRIDYKLDFFYKNPAEIIKMEDIVDYRSDYNGVKYALSKEKYEEHQNLLFKRLTESKPIHYDIKTSFRKWDFQNGRTVGNKKNKSLFIRCYEKLVDTLCKGKTMLYDDYFIYKNVFRLEIEFLSKFNKRENGISFTYKEISELEYKIQRFMGLTDRIIGEKFLYQYKENIETDFSKLRRQREFWGRGYSLYKKWFNPFIILYKVLKDKIMDDTMFNYVFNERAFNNTINAFKEYLRSKEAKEKMF